ncbi:uncharacterized protein CCR75_001503 [Bremia lactucae]|uniref:Uncharacterized protein n=1 Tax=Bremia lactucae TaxID=4779 RepID=A0A976FGN6_BRELC|nr:hypothetical protein CCR75_001503 [Bremia lactucae]
MGKASLLCDLKHEPTLCIAVETSIETSVHDSHVHSGPTASSSTHLSNADSAMRKLQLACCGSFLFMCLQFAGGYYADSLAIMTDAAHLLSDVAGFLVSLFAMYLGQFPATATMPFGYYRAEVIGALLSVLSIWVLAIGLLGTAIKRLVDQGRPDAEPTVDGKAMFLVALSGLGMNLMLMKILGHGHHHHHHHGHCHEKPDNEELHTSIRQTPVSSMALMPTVDGPSNKEIQPSSRPTSVFENMNVRAAYIHALGDFVQSLGVCLAGALIWYKPSWQLADPITTIVFSCLVLGTTQGMLTKSIHILMEGAPRHLPLGVVETQLRALASVYDVHDLHIWMLTEDKYAASVHIVPNGESQVAQRETQRLFVSLGVFNVTIQVDDTITKDWNEELPCCGTSYATDGANQMSVPRASTKKAMEIV